METQSGRKGALALSMLLVLLGSLLLAACFGEEEPAKGTAASNQAASNTAVVAAGPLKFIYFYTADCVACTEMEPIIEQVTTDYKDKVVVEKYDGASADGKKLMDQYQLKKTPSYVILDAKGTQLWSNAGQIHKDMLNQQVQTLLPK